MLPSSSPRWRAVFGEVDPARTAADVDFLRRALPLPAFRRVLDVPCGEGRFVRGLGALGYEVTGVDGDPAVRPELVADLLELDTLRADYDAVVNMWASFGYFDAATNEAVLASFARRVRAGGRVVLDLYDRSFFDGRDGERELRPGVIERSRLRGDRLRCELDYGDGNVDVFEWQLYTADELEELGRRVGLTPVAGLGGTAGPALRAVLRRDPP